jgi:hypothetical protein
MGFPELLPARLDEFGIVTRHDDQLLDPIARVRTDCHTEEHVYYCTEGAATT